jgi:hypothetical protein
MLFYCNHQVHRNFLITAAAGKRDLMLRDWCNQLGGQSLYGTIPDKRILWNVKYCQYKDFSVLPLEARAQSLGFLGQASRAVAICGPYFENHWFICICRYTFVVSEYVGLQLHRIQPNLQFCREMMLILGCISTVTSLQNLTVEKHPKIDTSNDFFCCCVKISCEIVKLSSQMWNAGQFGNVRVWINNRPRGRGIQAAQLVRTSKSINFEHLKFLLYMYFPLVIANPGKCTKLSYLRL